MLSRHGLPVLAGFWSPELVSRFARLNEQFAAARSAHNAFQEQRPTIEDFKKLPLPEMKAQIDRSKVLNAEYDATRESLEACEREMATDELGQRVYVEPIPLQLPEGDDKDDNSYALYRGTVWVSERSLEPEQWKRLIDRLMEREEAELRAALATEEPDCGRERLSTEVRRAVWIRDQGRCSRCGSRERLEYDHIIPVSQGGGNTERNIELLCEVCNRANQTRFSKAAKAKHWSSEINLLIAIFEFCRSCSNRSEARPAAQRTGKPER
jgi:hypothetical protein